MRRRRLRGRLGGVDVEVGKEQGRVAGIFATKYNAKDVFIKEQI